MIAALEVLSIVPPLIVKVPLPKAPALLISKVPALKVSPPLKVLMADSVNVPAETLTFPVLVCTALLSSNVPEPALPKLKAPLIIPPSVNVLAVTVTVGDAPKVTAPVPRFKLDEPVKVKLPFHVWALLFVDVVMADP